MRTRLHLVSAPWASPRFPSLQLGALKAFVDRELGGAVETFSYSAFLAILYRMAETRCLNYYDETYDCGEAVYMLLYHERFSPSKKRLSPKSVSAFLERLNRKRDVRRPLTPQEIRRLGEVSLDYVKEEMLPNLIDDGVNAVGYTMNFKQVYSSLYLAKLLEELAPGKKFLHVFGGFSAGLPNIASVLSRLGIEGYCVFGEGEKKLKALLEAALAAPNAGCIAKPPTPGIFAIGEEVDLFERHEAFFRSELDDLRSLPEPEYSEYFSLHSRIAAQDEIFRRTVNPVLSIEGSRGCFAKCDFCNLNFQWEGFRKTPVESIVERARALARKHGTNHLFFSDNVCDAFAEKFADALIETPSQPMHFFMELRAHHPQAFWVKLARAGITSMQVGVEALSAPLLKKMAKGTLVIQNLRAQKYAKELGVISYSGIITHHPKSDLGDALETKRVLARITHLDALSPNRFSIGTGSPIYNKLSKELKKALVPLDTGISPPALRPYVAGFGYEVPRELLPPHEIAEAWEEVRRLCLNFRPSTMTVTRGRSGSLCIEEERAGKTRKLKLEGTRARLYEACHEGLKLEMLEERLQTPSRELRTSLDEMLDEKIMLLADGYYLSLALRPKSELLET